MNFHRPPYIIKVDRLWVNAKAITLYPFIFIEDLDDLSLLAHEMIHIKQVNRGWIIGFYIKYLYYNIRYGYRHNPYEVEAYKHQDD